MSVPLVNVENWQSGCTSHRRTMSRLRTSGAFGNGSHNRFPTPRTQSGADGAGAGGRLLQPDFCS